MKIYCEHGALTKILRNLQSQGKILLVQFPYDPHSRSKRLSESVPISAAQWRDLNTSWANLGGTWENIGGSEVFPEILKIVGPNNRRDALHVDSAYKAGCAALITEDTDILNQKISLEALTSLKIFHGKKDEDDLLDFIASSLPK